MCEERLEDVVQVLKEGGMILHATDTVWGLAADSFSESAVEKVFAVKDRPRDKKMILLVSDKGMLKRYVSDIHPRIDVLLDYYERPLSVVYPLSEGLPSYLLSEDGSVAIRIVQDEYTRSIIDALGRPIVSSSANIAGSPTPKSFARVSRAILGAVDYVVQYRMEEVLDAPPSILIQYDDRGAITFLRS